MAKVGWGWACAIGWMLSSDPALAQDVPTSTSTSTAATETATKSIEKSDQDQLEEITVTAQRRAENIQEVPVSVSTLDKERAGYLRSAGEDVRFLAARMPSLNIESSFGRTFPRFYIRGLGNPDFDLNASQPVLFILDDIVMENPTLKGFPIFDLERIEMYRGPQGTLFGRNTPAGVVRFESVKPKQSLEAYGRFTYGQFNFAGFEGAANAPIVEDILAARISMLYERRDDWVDNEFTMTRNTLEGFRDVAGRFQLLFTPTDRSSLLLNLHAHSLNGTARLFRANIIEPGTDDIVDGFDRGSVSIDGQNMQRLDQLGFTANLSYDFGPVVFNAVFGYDKVEFYSRGDIDGGFGAVFAPPSGPGDIPFPSESADGVPELDQLMGEARFVSDVWYGLSFQAGVFIFSEDLIIESFSYDSLAGGVQNGYARQNQEALAFGVYGTATYTLLDMLRLTAGFRWSDDNKTLTAERITSPIGGGEIGPLTAETHDSSPNFDVSLTYFITKGWSAYLRAASSFRAPSIQGRILFGDALSVADSENMLSYEGGVKSELFGNRARINLAGYYYELRDQQLTAVGGTSNFNTLLNAEKTIGAGFELDAEFLPISGLFITLGLSFNHTSIRDPALAVATCGAPCNVRDPPGSVEGTALLRGNQLPNAPQWIGNLTARYGLPVHDDGELFVFADIAYRSRIHFFLYESVEYTDKNLIEIGARLGYSRFDQSFEVSVFVRNLTNDVSLTGGIDFNNLTGFVNEPRLWGVQSIVRFN